MNVKSDDLKFTLAKNQIDENKQEQIIADLKALIESEKEEGAEKKEYRHVGLSFNGEEYEGLPFVERPVYLFKFEASEDPNTIDEKLKKAKQIHNSGKKTGKRPVNTINEILQNCSAKTIRDAGLKVVSKEPVFLIEKDNDLA